MHNKFKGLSFKDFEFRITEISIQIRTLGEQIKACQNATAMRPIESDANRKLIQCLEDKLSTLNNQKSELQAEYNRQWEANKPKWAQ